jgi:hypothetical protein
MDQQQLLELLQQQEQPDWFQSLTKPKDLGWGISKLTSTLNGIGSLPDVLYNTNSPLDNLTIGPRYLVNLLKGLGGSMIPGIDAPEFKTTSDVMKKNNWTTGNELGDMVVGLGGDMALDPTMYLGTGAIGNIASIPSKLKTISGKGVSGQNLVNRLKTAMMQGNNKYALANI